MSTHTDNKLCLAQIMGEIPADDQKQLLNILNQLQEKNGYIAERDLEELAVLSGTPESVLHGLMSFFSSYRTRPLGRNHLLVCSGTACYACGADLIYNRLVSGLDLDEYGTSPDGFITVEKVQCVGACSLAPVTITNKELEGKVKFTQITEKLASLRRCDGGQGA
ncbi:NAD(P)H-dependent oxidoreductase subunit E [Desulfitobacterium chlororespirans]|uniref:NADH-quinone oxidoreductase subunit E n=1 Tax=Desulfitobacterium chlororespirans DSM 11544 TaxID=1121395 RepID=A0A1M7SI15_9FIRM|nr:NAD(P)H-dependent oxidoreductase subunit E [Desulfitobacterium chlororespirans]SHN58128.1 NADH-quinone oxidoreductase subunit E [Desulfitobacterium chlororespirans DSM 11544]